MEELKPCPFCPDGGKPYVLTGKCYTFENGIGSTVECEKCLSSGPLCNTEKEAIEAWNTRAEPAYLAGYKDGYAVGKFESYERSE